MAPLRIRRMSNTTHLRCSPFKHTARQLIAPPASRLGFASLDSHGDPLASCVEGVLAPFVVAPCWKMTGGELFDHSLQLGM